MIGILIALQINNWNEDRKDRKQETVILQEILEEFRYNRAEFQANLDRYAKVRSRLNTLVGDFPIDPQNVDTDEIGRKLEGTNFIGDYDESTTTLDKLKNSNSYDIISNEELRSLLLRWEVLAIDYAEAEGQALDFHETQYAPVMELRLPRPYSLMLKDPRVDLSFLGSLEFEALVRRKLMKVNNLFRVVEQQKGNNNIVFVMDRIIELTEQELSLRE